MSATRAPSGIEALAMAKVWENFLTNDLSGDSHGFAEIAQYLIKDSFYYNMAYEYSNGVDNPHWAIAEMTAASRERGV